MGRWYILHAAPDFEHLQLTEVNQAMMDHLVAQPLFSIHAIGSFRLLDDEVDLPRDRRGRRRSYEVPEVIASPVDVSGRPPENSVFTGSVGVYNGVVIHHEVPRGEWARIEEVARVDVSARQAARDRLAQWAAQSIDAAFLPDVVRPAPQPRRGRKKPEPKKLEIAPEISGRKFWRDDD